MVTPIRLTKFNDLFYGTPTRDVVYADNGNDTLYGYGGNDELWGGWARIWS